MAFGDEGRSFWIAHGVLMILAWGFFIPVGTLLAVYRKYVGKDGKILKNEPSFYPWHRNLQWIGFLLAMIGFGMAAAADRRVYGTGRAFDDVLLRYMSDKMPWNRHVKLGVSVLIIAGVQVLMGIIHHWLKDRHASKPDAGPWKRPIVPSWLHVVMGFCCSCLAYVTIYQGLQIYDFIFYKLEHSPGIIAGYALVSISGFLFLSFYIHEKIRFMCAKFDDDGDDKDVTEAAAADEKEAPAVADQEADVVKQEEPLAKDEGAA